MPEPPQITHVDNRAVVRLKSWCPLPRGGTEFFQSSQEENITPLPGEGLGGGGFYVPAGLGSQVRLLHLGPGEWLAISDVIAGPTLEDRLRRHVGGQNIAAVDLSCALKALRVDGLAARELLAKGCGLDLHPKFFPPGRATRTRLAQLAVIVDCVDPTSRFELYVGRSYLTWLRSWLVDASAS